MLRQFFIFSLIFGELGQGFLFTTKACSLTLISEKYKVLLSQAESQKPDLNPNPNPLSLPASPEQIKIKAVVPLTLSECIELAKANNRQFQIVKLQLEQSRAQLDEAEAGLYPTLGVQAQVNRQLSAQGEIQAQTQQKTIKEQSKGTISQQQQLISALTQIRTGLVQQGVPPSVISVVDLQLLQAQGNLNSAQSQLQAARQPSSQLENFATTTIDGSLNLNYAIFSIETQARINVAREFVRQSELEVIRQEEELRLRVTQAYYDLELADEQVRISSSDVDSRSKRLEQIKQLLEATLVTRLDVLNAQVELDNSRQQLKNAQAQQFTAQSNLVRILSLPFSVTPRAADEIKIAGEWDLSLEESILLAFKNRVELEQSLSQRRQREAERDLAYSAIQPKINLFASYNVSDLSSDQPDSPGFFAPRGTADGYSFGILFNWDFFDGGAAQARARQAEVGIAIADQTYADNSQQIRADVEQAYIQLPTQKENVETAKIALQNAKEAVNAAQVRFNAAVNTQTEVLDAQTRLVQAENNLVQAIIGYNRALAQLQRAVGSPYQSSNSDSSNSEPSNSNSSQPKP